MKKKLEYHPLGEVFVFNDISLKVELDEKNGCEECFFRTALGKCQFMIDKVDPLCDKIHRDDLKSVSYRLVGKCKTTGDDAEPVTNCNALGMPKINTPILDACCGGKMFYFDKNDSRVLFQDIRELSTELCDGRHFEVKPDVIADFTNMPYPDESFSMVVFDPPHLKYTGSKKEADGWQMIKYGSLNGDWKDVLSKGFAECFRVLRPGGFLIFKWNETDIPLSKILKLTPAKPVFGHRSGKVSKTHWVCFVKDY